MPADSGGTRHASKKTFRRRDYGAASQSQGMERGERQAAPRICVQGFRRGVRQHDSRGARRRIDEPSSRMVQRVEQSGDRPEHAQRERNQRLRFRACGKNQRNLRRLICPFENDLPRMSADRQPQKSSRSWIFLAVRWAAALLILGILLYLLPVAPLRAALSRVPISRFIAVLLIYFVAVTGGITKWHTVVNSAGAQLSFAASAQCYTSGLFGALFLPSIIGGDVARLAVGISRSPRPAAVVTGNV